MVEVYWKRWLSFTSSWGLLFVHPILFHFMCLCGMFSGLMQQADGNAAVHSSSLQVNIPVVFWELGRNSDPLPCLLFNLRNLDASTHCFFSGFKCGMVKITTVKIGLMLETGPYPLWHWCLDNLPSSGRPLGACPCGESLLQRLSSLTCSFWMAWTRRWYNPKKK